LKQKTYNHITNTQKLLAIILKSLVWIKKTKAYPRKKRSLYKHQQMKRPKITVFWFRRDLRIKDNHGLYEALNSNYPVLPVFNLDTNITDELKQDDPRISFIHEQLTSLNKILQTHYSGIYLIKGKPEIAWRKILNEYDVDGVYFNEDYEPYAIQRDKEIQNILKDAGINCFVFKDQVIFSKDDILKADRTPYLIYTPYKNKWLQKFQNTINKPFNSKAKKNYYQHDLSLPSLSDLGFIKSTIKVINPSFENLNDYENVRDYPNLNKTSHLSPHLRFGTIGIRTVVQKALVNQHFLNELIWREFFMQILYHFPKVVNSNFKSKYDLIEWRNNKCEFEKWKNGETGYPMVDAGMRELNTTGYMHNRVRMITASFLCKHLLIDWRWGEAYFAEKLLDYELASNNGNWQWSAGTGCDAAPYFRVFNPTTQIQKYDREFIYIKKWIPELNTSNYPTPIVEHKMARERAIKVYKIGLKLNLL